ncbi:MAG: RHS repeat protein, partial [Betaproteobacteria bacterium]|nr:RHS repeat protein [Betaproteobacteria bacterium]
MTSIIGSNALRLERSSASVLAGHGQLGSAATGRLGSMVSVNAVTGNLVIRNQDEVLASVGPDARLFRTYNSLGQFSDDNGDNWRESVQRRIDMVSGGVNAAGSVVRLTDWDGSTAMFGFEPGFQRNDGGTGAYVNREGGGAYDTLLASGNVWDLTDGESLLIDRFDASGRLIATRDPDGVQVSYSYDASGRMSRVTAASGEYTELVWSGGNLTRLETRSSAGGLLALRTRYAYDGANRLVGVTIDRTPEDGVVSDGNTVGITYTYDGDSKRVASISETGSGNFVSFTYVQVGSDFRIASVVETVADGTTATTTYAYDTGNQRTTVTDPLGKVTVIAYDAAGNLTSIAAPPDGSGALSQVEQFAYNGNGDVVGHTDALGRLTSYTYDAHGNLTEGVDPAGNHTRYECDARNRLLKKVLVVNVSGLDRLPFDGVDSAFYQAVYTDIGDTPEYNDPAQHYAVHGWHERRNPNAMFDTNWYLNTYTDIANAGIDPLQHYLQNGWREGRQPASWATTAEFIARYVNQTTRYVYDGEAHLRFEVTQEGRVTEYRYDAVGQRVATIQYTRDFYPVAWTLASWDNLSEAAVANWVSTLGSTTAIQRTDTAYDFRGNVALVTDYSDLNVNRVQFSKFESGTGGWWAWQSTANMLQGAPVTATEPSSQKAYISQMFRGASPNDYVAFVSGENYAATPGERLAVRAGVSGSAGIANLQLRVQFFDQNDNWVTEIHVGSLGGTQPFNSLISGFVDVPAGAKRVRLVLYANAATPNTNVSFNMTEPMIAQATPDQIMPAGFVPGLAQSATRVGQAQNAGYNRTAYTYDQFGNLLAKWQSGTDGYEVFAYDGLGRVIAATDLLGQTTTTAYNDGARTTLVTLANGQTRTSVYSARGEILSYAEAAPGVATATENYKYDKLGRLRVSVDALAQRDFTFYDDAGRKSGYMDRKGQLTEFRYDAENRLVATIRYANAMSGFATGSLYDANGQPTRATITGARPQPSNYDRWEWNVYDAADRVAQTIETVRGAWEGQSGKVTTFEYDRAGQLVRTVESANVLAPYVVAQMMAQTPGTNLLLNGGLDGPGGWTSWNPNGIVQSGSPYVWVWQDQHFLKAEVNAAAAGNVASLRQTDAFKVESGQFLSIQTGVEAYGSAAGTLTLAMHWVDANGAFLSSSVISSRSGGQAYNTPMGGTVTVPTGAVKGLLELYMWTSGAGTGAFVLVEPKVTVAGSGMVPNIWQNAAFDNGLQNWNQWGSPGISFQTNASIVTDANGHKAITATFQANAAGAVATLYSDSKTFYLVTPGERLAVSETITTSGAVQQVDVWAEFFDANDQSIVSKYIGIANGSVQSQKVSGFVPSVPANAKWMRLHAWTRASALNTNVTLTVSDPVVTVMPTETNLWQEANFESGANFWNQWGPPASVVFQTNPTVVTDGQGAKAISTTFQATAANVNVALYSDSTNMVAIEPGRRLAVSERIYGSGALAKVDVWAQFFDANYNFISSTFVGSASAGLGSGVTVSGFLAGMPANAKLMRLLSWGSASALNTNATFSVSSVSVGYADPAQATVPTFAPSHTSNFAFSATPAVSAADRVTRNFYSRDRLLIGTLDGAGGFTQYTYDKAGRLTRTRRFINPVPPAMRAGGNYTQVMGSIVSSVNDRTEYLVYDGEGQVRFRLDGNLRPTEYVYDAAGRVVRTVEYAGSIPSAPEISLAYVKASIASLGLAADPAKRVSRAIFDGAGHKVFDIDALGGVTAYAYEAKTGLVFRTSRFAAPYTASADPDAQTMWNWAGSAPVQLPGNVHTRMIYDALGRLAYSVDGEGYVTEYQYDLDDRVIGQIRYAGQYAVYDGATPATMAALLVGANAAGTVRTTNVYDAAGQLTDTWDGDLSTGWDNQSVRTHFDYNAFGQVWQTVEAAGSADEAISRILYDAAGRVLGAYSAVGTPDQTNQGFVYDGVGNLMTYVDTRNRVTNYVYDALGNRTRESKARDEGGWADTWYEYNAFGERVKTTDPLGNTSYAWYDRLGRAWLVLDAAGYATATTFTALGQAAAVRRYATAYSDSVNPAAVPALVADSRDAITAFTYDRLGRVLSTTDAEGFAENYAYDAEGNRVSVTNKLGGVTRYTFDRRGLMTAESTDKLSYDREGNVVAGQTT